MAEVTGIGFNENPYDIITLLESIRIATEADYEYEFLDIFLTELRENPDVCLTDLCHTVLMAMNLLEEMLE